MRGGVRARRSDCECDTDKYKCACAECKKLVVPMDEIPAFQRALGTTEGLKKLRSSVMAKPEAPAKEKKGGAALEA